MTMVFADITYDARRLRRRAGHPLEWPGLDAVKIEPVQIVPSPNVIPHRVTRRQVIVRREGK